MPKEVDGPSTPSTVTQPLLSQASGSRTPPLQRQGTRDEHDHSVLGLVLYAVSSCFLATTLVFTKKLAFWHMPVFEILIARSATIAVFALGGCAVCRVNPLGNKRWLLLIRGLFGFGAIGNYFFAVALLPLNDALVISFTAPIWAGLLGPFFLKEKSTKAVGVALAMCMGGLVLITQPSFLGFAKNERSLLGIFFACFQALCSACAKMCVRFLRNTESPHVSVFYQAWVSLVIALCASLIPRALGHPGSIRQVDGWVEWTFMAGVGLTSYGSQICMTNALRFARAAPALAMSYVSVIITLIYGYFIFNEVPTVFSLLGSLLILSSTLMLGVFEKRKDKEVEQEIISRRASLESARESEAGLQNGYQSPGASEQEPLQNGHR